MRLLDAHGHSASGLLRRGHGLTAAGTIRAIVSGLTSNATHGVTAQLGTALAGSLIGLAGGETIVHRWLLNGVVITGANSATYTPLPAQDLDGLQYAPLVDGTEVASITFTVRRAPPVAGSLTAVNEVINSRSPTVNLAAGFTGDDLTYTSDQPWATVPANGDVLTVSTTALRTDTVTITATNSGGSVVVPLSVTISQRAATTLHVQWSAGDDATGDGTIGNPFQTHTGALVVAIPGDTIAVRPGIYPPFRLEKSGTSGARIIITTLPGEEGQAIVQGSLQDHVINDGAGTPQVEADRDGIYVLAQDHFEILNHRIRDVWRCGIFVVGAAGEQHGNVRIAGNTVSNTGSSSISVQGMNSATILPLAETSNLP